jgi:hypothetical protein
MPIATVLLLESQRVTFKAPLPIWNAPNNWRSKEIWSLSAR